MAINPNSQQKRLEGDLIKKSQIMKIIYVDTNRYARSEMQEQIPLIEPNSEIHCFERSEPALEFAKKQGCDVLLTEIEFWSDSHGGIKLAKDMKEINPDVKIIFVTVCDKNEVARELKEIMHDGFLSKLWAKEELAAALKKLTYIGISRNGLAAS